MLQLEFICPAHEAAYSRQLAITSRRRDIITSLVMATILVSTVPNRYIRICIDCTEREFMVLCVHA